MLDPSAIERADAEVNDDAPGFKLDSPFRHQGIIQFIARFGEPPMLELRENGDAFVRGEKVDNNVAVYEAFKVWLARVSSTEQ